MSRVRHHQTRTDGLRRRASSYANKLLKTSATLELLAVYDFDCGIGIVSRGQGRYLIARGTTPKYGAKALPAREDPVLGIALD